MHTEAEKRGCKTEERRDLAAMGVSRLKNNPGDSYKGPRFKVGAVIRVKGVKGNCWGKVKQEIGVKVQKANNTNGNKAKKNAKSY